MKTKTFFLLGAALASSLALGASGQSSTDSGSSAATTLFEHPARASDIIGKRIEDYHGRKFGTVKDLAVDLENGRIVEVIIAQENYWGRDKRTVAVPPDVLTPTGGGKVVYSDLDQKKLPLAPVFDLSQWNDSVAQPRVEAVYQCFGETPYFLVQEHAAKDANEPSTRPLGEVRRASQLIGVEAVNYICEDLGKVRDLVVELGSGRLAEVILNSGSYLGMSGELSAVPPQALRFTPDRTLRLDVTKDVFSNAPHFPTKSWPQFDRKQIVAVYQAYHVVPYLLPVGIEGPGVSERAPLDPTQNQAGLDITGKNHLGIKESAVSASN